MDDESFWKDVDQKVAQVKQSATDSAQGKQRASEVTRKAIAQVKPVLEQYKTELGKRDIEAELSIGGHDGEYLVFRLRYKDGEYYAFEMGDGMVRLQLKERGTSYTQPVNIAIVDPMDAHSFKQFVQQFISDFIEGSTKHQGFLRPKQ
jgi:hypothetical protein